MNEILKKNHYREFDVIRGIAILIIVSIHTTQRAFSYVAFLFNSAVPMFCCLSAILLTINYNDKLELKSYYKQRYKYLLPNYLFWMAVLIFRNLFSNGWTLRACIVQYIVACATGAMITLYFMIIIFIFYSFFPFLLRFIKKLNFRNSIILLLISVTILVILYVYSLNNFLFFLNKNIIIFNFEVDSVIVEFSIGRYLFVIFMLPFFIFGIIIGLNYEIIKEKMLEKKWIITISSIYVLSLLLFYLFPISETAITSDYNSYLNYNVLFLTLIQMIFFICIFNNFSVKWLQYVGKKATGLYLTHRPVQIVLLFLFTSVFNFGIQNLFYGWIFFIIVLICCLLFIFVIQKLPKSEYIIKN